MNKVKKVLAGIAALAALALGGAAIANATGGDGSDQPDVAVSGSTASQAGDAARSALGGGDVVSVESSDEGGAAVYEVKVKQDGKVTEVQLDKSFAVTAQKPDDDAHESGGAGDGETDDD
jgi:uncharacterized membrane protein YkoI